MRILDHTINLSQKLSWQSIGYLFLLTLFITPISVQNAYAQIGEWIELKPQGDVPHSAGNPALVYDSSRDVVFYIGSFADPEQDNKRFPEIWEWDGSRWKFIKNEDIDFVGKRIVYDSKHNEIIKFGGRTQDSAFFGTQDRVYDSSTYKWNIQNKEWDVISTEGPGGRTSHEMVFDSKRGVIVMHGGLLETGGQTNETWIWDGSTRTWTNATDPQSSSIFVFKMVYDESRDRIITFHYIDTYEKMKMSEWDGTQWKNISPNVQMPSNRSQFLVTYDHYSQRIYFYGGGLFVGHDTPRDQSDDTLIIFNDTWTWDGTAWTLLHPGNETFPVLSSTTLISIPNKNQLFTFGGLTKGPIQPKFGDPSNQTWVYQFTPSSVHNWLMFR